MHEAVMFGGDPAKVYRVVLRFRGVVEPKQYAGGIPDVAGSNGQFYEGGAGAGDPIYNTYGLAVSDPPQDYYLNAWTEGDFVIALDYRETLSIRGGAEVTLYGYTKLCALSYDCADLTKVPDCSPKSLAGVAHLPDKGQFIQIDAESVSSCRESRTPSGRPEALDDGSGSGTLLGLEQGDGVLPIAVGP